jgi:SIR2-like domain
LEPIPSLSISMQSMPGTFALLLGSGISSASGIPTGYHVTLDLIHRLAAASGETCEDDPETWFQSKFGQAPSYSTLLRQLAPRPAERSAILRQYFEPSESERQADLKRATPAHRAIADLVAGGYITVIMTTNFDRLMEEALEDKGIRPVIVSTVESARGAPPMHHNTCTVTKLHGDYLDENIKNTDEELATYPRIINRLLDRVLDEYGLIVCGWSAAHDAALRRAFERCQNQRYSTYWTSKSEPGIFERRLIDLRRAVPVPIADADSFFEGLRSSVSDLAARAALGHTGSGITTPQALVHQVERLIGDPAQRARLRRLIDEQVSALESAISDREFPLQITDTIEGIAQRMQAYENLSANVIALSATVAFFADDAGPVTHLGELLRLLAERPLVGGYMLLINLRLYPALLMLYTGGLAALAADKYETYFRLMSQPITVQSNDGSSSAVVELDPRDVLLHDVAQQLPSLPNNHLYTPLSEHLYGLLREPLRQFVHAVTTYERLFDRYEYLAALLAADATREESMPTFYIGRFGWRARQHGWTIQRVVNDELASHGTQWPLLAAGGFDGDLERALAAQAAVDGRVARVNWW